MAQIIIQGIGAGSTLRCSNNNSAPGACSTVAGGANNRSTRTYSTVGGGFQNSNVSSGATIGGGQCNTIGENIVGPLPSGAKQSINSTIIGGINNKSIEGFGSFIGGGSGNTSSGLYNTILGGVCNTNSGGKQQTTIIGGGCQNTTTNSYSIIGGGYKNTSRGIYSIIVGGCNNFTCNSFGIVMGGSSNRTLGSYNFIGGGRQNTTNNCQVTLGGGCLNTSFGGCSVLGGGLCNTISTTSNSSSIIGGQINKINSELSIIGGGIANEVYGLTSVIGGGRANIASGDFSSVLGGRSNTASGYQSSVLGGFKNTAHGINSVIFSSNSWVTGNRSVVLGGQNLLGPNDDTVYVPGLNVSFLGTNTSINNLGIDIDGNVVVGDSSTNNYAVDGLLVEDIPSILGVFVPDQNNLNATKLENGAQQVLTNVIYDDLSAYDSSTGVWTCPLNGRYNMSFFIHLSDPLQGWLTSVSPAPTVGGALVAGLVNFVTGEIYASNSFLASVPQLYADINGASWGIELTTGDQICLKIMNTTGISYIPQVGDYLRFSLQKIG
jgi:hypothetical protein